MLSHKDLEATSDASIGRGTLFTRRMHPAGTSSWTPACIFVLKPVFSFIPCQNECTNHSTITLNINCI